MAQSTAKRGRPTKQQAATKKSRDLREARRKQRAGLYSVILFAVGFMLLAITFIEGQNVWNYLHRFLFGLLGVCAYITGPLVLMLAVMCAYQKTVSTAKIIESALFAISFSGALFIFTKQQLMGESFWEKLKNLYFSGISKAGGGLSSAILGAPLRAWFGTPGAEITIALLMFVFIMLFAGRTVADIINGVKRPIDSIKGRLAAEADEEDEESVAKQERNYREVEQQVNENAAKLKARTPVKRSKSAEIDISIDGELSKAKRTDIKIDENNAYNVPLGPTFDPVPRSIELEPTGPAAQVVKEIFEKSQREAELEDKLFAKFEKSTQQTSVNEYAKAPGDKLDELVKKASQPIAAQTAKAEPVRRHTEYRFPPIGMLKKAVAKPQSNVTAELRANADKLVSTLESFGVKTKVVDISRGPAVTRYELQPEVGVRLSRIVSLSDDLALNLAAPGVRIEAPIPGKAAVGIEVPNKTVNIVNLREVIESSVFTDAKEPLTFALGKDISGAVQVGDIAKMPHLLIAGSTGMGKSVC
ncbi:MAG: DNA translocase FtsK, partial [Oscillospiraceae bacterium]